VRARWKKAQWKGWIAAIAATLVTAGLVLTDISDLSFRRWFLAHALTTDTVSGLLVLLITFQVADQVVKRRQIKDRSQAIAAQTAIMMAQAERAAKAVSSVVAGSPDRDAALDEVRTYMVMLLVGAPVMIDGTISRNFLEQAQSLGGELARAMTATSKESRKEYSPDRLDAAVSRLREASAPLLRPFSADERLAASGLETD
jgi:hypothetical protein